MSTQISFSLRVSSGVKTVHLVGSWDNYNNQLPLCKDKASTSGKSWRGTFRFSTSTLEAGERYWYYYLVDGYHCAANPSVSSIVEPTTGRELNILEVPVDNSASKPKSSKHSSSSSSPKSSSTSSSKHSSSSSSKHSSSNSKYSSSSSSSKPKSSSSREKDFKDRDHKDRDHKDRDRKARRLSVDIPKGRPLSTSEIRSPKPVLPLAANHILRYDEDEIDALAAQFGGTIMIDDEGAVSGIHMGSPASSLMGSSYRSDSSSPSGGSGSGYSTPSSDYGVCTCENFGITRRGDRIKIDCGGRVCCYSDCASSDCSSGSEAEASPIRRRGIVVR